MRIGVERKARTAAYHAARAWDRTRFAIKGRLGLFGRPIIMPYRGFGDASEYWVKGRVLQDPDRPQGDAPHSLARDLWLTFKRYETDEVPGATLRWRFGRLAGEAETDEEGFFEFRFKPGAGHQPDRPWQTVTLDLLDSPVARTGPQPTPCLVRTPAPGASFGIISDIDDTIIKTGATQFAKHWRTVIANSARARTPFPGLSAFYRGLVGEGERNPIFYVSSSPWNLFDLLEQFLVLHDIPVGPMLLKDFGLSQSRWLTGGHHCHKTEMIEALLRAYPELSFILIGDSGQRDAFIGRDLAANHPGRIAAIYLREIEGGTDRDKVRQALQAAQERGVDTVSGPDLWTAAQHAAERGWLAKDRLWAVAREIRDSEPA